MPLSKWTCLAFFCLASFSWNRYKRVMDDYPKTIEGSHRPVPMHIDDEIEPPLNNRRNRTRPTTRRPTILYTGSKLVVFLRVMKTSFSTSFF